MAEILLNFFDNIILAAAVEEVVPAVGFFKDRYFPTGAGDIFKADKVITEYRDGDRKLAAFVAPRVGDIPMTRSGYEITSIKPAYIAPSRLLTLDELTKRGFGEAIYPGMDEQQRAARLLVDDMADMDARITRREEWMAAQTMIMLQSVFRSSSWIRTRTPASSVWAVVLWPLPRTRTRTSSPQTWWAKPERSSYMKIVQIIAGGYGHRPKANAPAKLILAGEFVCLDDAEADRLVQQGVAVYGEPDEETREIVEQADADGNEPEPHPAAADKTPRRKARKTSAE